ncbi:MAG: ribbon-helix-helix domain-containing protein [Thermoanaerobaculia bacterium]
MKTAISLPDDVFEEAEELARRLGKSRSQLYAEAIEEYVARHDVETVTERMDRALEALDGTPDAGFQAAAQRTLRNVEW